MTTHIDITRSNADEVAMNDKTINTNSIIYKGSDTVNVNTNCSAGYDVYVSSTQNGSTDLVSVSSPEDRIRTSLTPIGSEAALEEDTWGVGKDGTTFAKLQAYDTETAMVPFYHDTVTDGKDFTFYYGANISTQSPGRYTTDVLYTVIAKNSCVEYSLSFDTSSATDVLTPSAYATRVNGVDELVDLDILSSESNIVKTGYHLTGWRNRNNASETYGNTGKEDVNPNDTIGVITLEPIWTINNYSVAYAAGDTGGSCSIGPTPAVYDQDVTLSTSTCSKAGYVQDGWSRSGSVNNTKDYSLGQTLTTPNFTSVNNGTYILYPHFATVHTVTISGGIIGTSGSVTSGNYSAGSTITIKANSPSTGHHFNGWSSNNGGTFSNSGATQTTFTVPDANVTITANSAANTYTIAYGGNGGSGSTSSQSVSYGSNVTLRGNGFSRSNYGFSGWGLNTSSVSYYANTSYAVSSIASSAGVVNNNGATITLYAIWYYIDPTPTCSSTVHPTTTSGCKARDGHTWIWGNGGNKIKWTDAFSGATNTNGHNATLNSGVCPSGYRAPSIDVLDSLVLAYGGFTLNSTRNGARIWENDLYTEFGAPPNGVQRIWSSTEKDASNVWQMRYGSGLVDTVEAVGKSLSYIILCYK
ncbi:InlB B-repeat-containing protein [Candidatus Saccharibacteria bacterium]|nr:InlB B-repeat-containing protein [Candidatus Saccharibacteria bacterium]